MKKFIGIAACLVLFLGTARAADTLWSVLWRPDYRAEVFASNDEGINWYSISSDPGWPIGEYTACALTRDLDHDFYLALWDYSIPLKLYKSTNYGVDWSYIADISGTNGGTDAYVSMICNPDGDLYAATWCRNHSNGYPRCFRSINQGASWTDLGVVCNLTSVSTESPISITSDTLGNLYIFLSQGRDGSSYPRFYKSSDNGNTWTSMNDKVLNIYCPDDPATGVTVGTDNTLWITFYYDYSVPWILHSVNEGVNWTQTASLSYPDGSWYNNYVDMVLGNSGALYVVAWGDTWSGDYKTLRYPYVYKSYDGTNWTYQGEIAHWIAGEHLSVSLLNVSMGSMGVKEREKASNAQLTISNYQLSIYPNPFTAVTRIKCQVPGGVGKSTLQIYDLSGRLVKSFSLITDYLSLTTAVEWDGRDNNGALAPGGVYFCQLRAGNEAMSKKMILMR